MYVMVNKATGKLIGYDESVYQLEDFIFNSLDDCIDYMYEDEKFHAEDMLVFKVDEAFKPVISFETVEDCIY